MQSQKLNLVYTLMCDDVRIEMGNKISLMGIFQNIMVEKLPVSLWDPLESTCRHASLSIL